MLTSSERSRLRSMATTLDTIFQIGKGGVTAETVRTVSDALEARELIKCRVLPNSGWTAREAAEQLAEATESEVVCTIGTKFVLYRRSEKRQRIFF